MKGQRAIAGGTQTEPVLTGLPLYAPWPSATEFVPGPAARQSRSLVSTGLALLSAQGVTWISTLLAILVVPRLMGASNLGMVSVATTLAGFAGVIANFGTGSYIVKEVARDPRRMKSIVVHGMLVRLVLWLAIASLFMGGAKVFGFSGTEMLVLGAVLVGMYLSLVSDVIATALQGAHRTGRSQLGGAIATLAVQPIAIAFLALTDNLVAYVWLVSVIVPLAVVVVMGRFLLQAMEGSYRFRFSELRELVSGGTPFLAWNLAQFSYASASPLLLGALAGAEAAGLYTFAFRIAAVPVFIATVITMTTFSTLAESARTDLPFFRKLLTQATRTSLVAAIPAGVGIAVVLPSLAGTIGGEEFRRAAPAIAILGLQVPSICIGTVIGTGIIALDKQRPWAVVGWASALGNIALTAIGVLLAPKFGVNAVVGAAVANLVVDVALMAAAWVLIGENIDRQAVGTAAVRTVASTGLMVVVVVALLPVNVFAAMAAGAAVYAVACLATRAVTPTELRQLRARPAAG